MKMKKWMALSCAAAMVLSTFPVSADEAVNEDVSGSITVWEHAYSFEEALKAVIEGFKAKYPNVEVDYEIKASDYQQVLATALQSGEGPDLFWTNGTATDIMPGYVNNGMVEDLTDVVDFSIITDDAMKLATIDGKQYSVPWLTMDSRACFYNKDIFAENGWEVPTTLEEFETLLGVTGSGKIMRAKAYKSHIMTKKSQKRKRNFRHETEVATADQKVVARNLGLR